MLHSIWKVTDCVLALLYVGLVDLRLGAVWKKTLVRIHWVPESKSR